MTNTPEVKRPRLLDNFSCLGGTSKGYEMAGFQVYGSDLYLKYNRKRYPYPNVKMDAIELLDRLLAGEKIQFQRWDAEAKDYVDDELLGLSDFSVLAGSPPCQAHSIATSAIRSTDEGKRKYPELIQPTRERFLKSGLPYVIENVKGAPMIKEKTITLCGSQFNITAVDLDGTLLHLRRHRQFESNVPLVIAKPCEHTKGQIISGSYGGAQRSRAGALARHGGYVASKQIQEALMGIDWMPEAALHQAIPPIFTQHIGKQLMEYLKQNPQIKK